MELAWGEGCRTGEEMVAAMDEAGVGAVLATDLLAWSYPRQTRFALDMTDESRRLPERF